jgi:hypothetical protein
MLGPRVTTEQFKHAWLRYVLPLMVFMIAGALLLISVNQPYWKIRLKAPQYPHGLSVTAFVTHLTGDVQELDELNHYIGMKKLGAAARFERTAAVPMVIMSALLLIVASTIHSRWAIVLALPALLFPLFFLVDLQLWLYYYGHTLDKTAALSSAIKPFTPRALGLGLIGQFKTLATIELGFQLSLCASGATLLGLWLHRRAYKARIDDRDDTNREVAS